LPKFLKSKSKGFGPATNVYQRAFGYFLRLQNTLSHLHQTV
jgi:hypothetical protein